MASPWAEDYIDAIRLALEASADYRVFRAVVREIVNAAPLPLPANRRSIDVLLRAVAASRATWVVNDEGQRIVQEAPRG